MGTIPQWPTGVWRVLGRSVQGAAHVRAGIPNQDAIQWFPDSGVGPPLILSVSDGHGSPRNFRSDVGARFAVEVTTGLMRELLSAGPPDPTRLTAIKRTAEERLPGEITRRWREAVAQHLKANPITPEELEALEKRRDPKARRAIEKDPHIAYGATLLSVLVTPGFILYLQLGDGDILTVTENGEVTRPMPHDPRLMANETTSLCMTDAWREVQIKFQALYGPHPALILLSSDGYANSFVNEAAFIKVGSDILDILRTDGLEAVEQNLEAWLTEASKAGSGDDITLGLVFPMEILPSAKPAPPAVTPKPPRAAPRRRKTTPPQTPATAKPPEKELPAPEKVPPVTEKAPEPPAPVETQTEISPGAQETPAEVLREEAEKSSQTVVPSETEKPAPAASPSEVPPRPKLELIKNEESPREPSKKLPNIFYGD
ncbi:MAG TPA: protein phosphatase 2C domain-containing protein [Anaerolineae bacterium]|nr:protein phosphatase 2C domain-containing protein [Anaerolineae bacterium]HQK14841.1 protein phosphatase 2C domain-containing protein [Anaerolineae bacterium]